MASNFCSKCGAHLEVDAQFCGSCGQAVLADAGSAAPPTDAAPVVPAATAAAADAGGDNNRWWKIGAAVLAVVLLVTVGLALTGDDSADAEVFLVAADEPGPDPFTASVAAAAGADDSSLDDHLHDDDAHDRPSGAGPGSQRGRSGALRRHRQRRVPATQASS